MKKKSLEFKRRLKFIASAILGLIAFTVFFMAPEVGSVLAGSLAIVPIWGYVKDKTFKELSADEVADLESDDQVKYFNELNLHKADQMNALKVEMKKASTEEIKAQIEALKSEILENNKEQMKALTKALEVQGLAITKLMTSKKDVPSVKSIEDYLYENVDKLKNAERETVTFKTDVTSASLVDSAFAYDVPGVGQLAHLSTKLLGLFASGSIADGQGGVVRYVDQTAVTRNADWVLEAGVKPESAIAWAVYTVPLETIADTIPVTNQSLSNIPFIASEIRNFLLTNLSLKVDASLWNGSGVAPNIFGIYTKAVEYVAAASGITDANVYDLIMKMKTNITATSNYTPNYILINPSDATNYLALKKDGNNNYMLPPFVELRNGMMFIAGMQVIETAAVIADTMLIGDFTKAVVYTHGGVKIDIGMIDKQFVENMVTLRAEQELGLVVRNVHLNAFNKETGIAAALVTLAL